MLNCFKFDKYLYGKFFKALKLFRLIFPNLQIISSGGKEETLFELPNF